MIRWEYTQSGLCWLRGSKADSLSFGGERGVGWSLGHGDPIDFVVTLPTRKRLWNFTIEVSTGAREFRRRFYEELPWTLALAMDWNRSSFFCDELVRTSFCNLLAKGHPSDMRARPPPLIGTWPGSNLHRIGRDSFDHQSQPTTDERMNDERMNDERSPCIKPSTHRHCHSHCQNPSSPPPASTRAGKGNEEEVKTRVRRSYCRGTRPNIERDSPRRTTHLKMMRSIAASGGTRAFSALGRTAGKRAPRQPRCILSIRGSQVVPQHLMGRVGRTMSSSRLSPNPEDERDELNPSRSSPASLHAERQTESSILLYKAPMGDLITRLKRISITSCLVSVVGLPALVLLKNGGTWPPDLAKQIGLGGFAFVTAGGSTMALHFVFGPYVLELHQILGGDTAPNPTESLPSNNSI